jgi:hypothetical protein
MSERRNGVAATEIVAAYDQVVQGDKSGFTHAIAFGELLRRAQGNSMEGTFLGWLKANCPGISRSTAYNYLKLTEPGHRKVLEENVQRVGHFSLRGALRLIKAPLTEKEKADRKVAADARKAEKLAAAKADLETMLRDRAVEEIVISIEAARPADLQAISDGLRASARRRQGGPST